MSDRLPKVDNLCTNPANHKFHMCELRLAGLTEKIEKLQEKPTFICGNCGTLANDAGALCAPGPADSK
ncbi:hypothetical protein [Desulfopila sp. IMCC35008]|uniref:hypothetical protein n=1 Tax=Desulfopila sp. IMCC35008 TaxID=2653858 RepID=UPI0013D533F1|nr:hypothetical protein [Desulfopila sp. IMCC35008]